MTSRDESVSGIYNFNIKSETLHRFIQDRGSKGIMFTTPQGERVPVVDAIRKPQVECIEIQFSNGHSRQVASTHRFMGLDGREVFAKDATVVKTLDGTLTVTSKTPIGVHDVFDFTIPDPHWYVDQYGVIHHNTGKSLGLVSLASDYMRQGLNVLYISCEMSEALIMSRIDANSLGVGVNDIGKLDKESFTTRVDNLRRKSYGDLVVKEYPPGSCTVVQIRNLVNELRMKRKFIPDVIMVDYLQIMASYRMKMGTQGSYFYFKAVAEELRALAVETNTVIWTAAQFNRGGMNATEVGMEDIAESTGIAQTADGMWALIRTEELDELGQLLVKQLKSRYANKAVKLRFCIGVDINTQTLYDLDDDKSEDMLGPESAISKSQTQLKDRFMSFK